MQLIIINPKLKNHQKNKLKAFCVSIPMTATFFINYIMVDGLAGVAWEILRLRPLIIYHFNSTFLVKNEKDREEAMDPESVGFNEGEPQIQLYFLLGLVYSVVFPILLPFIILFFAFAYITYRHQIINVYNQEFESGAAFWPDVHGRIITALVVSQLLLMGLLSTKGASQSTPLLITLSILTIWFHFFYKGRYGPTFNRYPLQEATIKDKLERVKEPNLNLKSFLQNAYIRPVLRGRDDSDDVEAAKKLINDGELTLAVGDGKEAAEELANNGGWTLTVSDNEELAEEPVNDGAWTLTVSNGEEAAEEPINDGGWTLTVGDSEEPAEEPLNDGGWTLTVSDGEEAEEEPLFINDGGMDIDS